MTLKDKYTHNNNLDLSPLKSKMIRVLLNIADNLLSLVILTAMIRLHIFLFTLNESSISILKTNASVK